MADIGTAIASLTATAKLLRGARDDAKIRDAQIELQQRLSDALTTARSQMQTTHALELEAQQLRTAKLELQAQVEELKRDLEKRLIYRKAQPVPGKWAYLAASDLQDTPATTAYVCSNCYANGKEVLLQYEAAGAGYEAELVCPVDTKHVLRLGGALPLPNSNLFNHHPF